MQKSLQTAFENESIVLRIMAEQETNGVQFNERRAKRYISYITRKKEQLYNTIRPLLHMEVIQPYGVPVNRPFKKDGTYSDQVLKWFPDCDGYVCGQFTRVEFREPDIGSRQKLQQQLLQLGWRPLHFTAKGNPKLTVDGQPCNSLLKIDSVAGKAIAEYYILSHRQSQIQGFLDRLRPSKRLPAGAFTIGTPTFRMRHKTVVNVPKASPNVVFGKQMRSLFTGEPLVGHDASGLELRMLAHYINDPEYTKVITEQDPHEYHRVAAGLPTRDDAKTFIYRFIYGGGNLSVGLSLSPDIAVLKDKYTERQAKVAYDKVLRMANSFGMVDIGKKTFVPASMDMAYVHLYGEDVKKKFLSFNPNLEDLIKRVQKAAERGYLMGLDGRRIRMRRGDDGKVATHKALNTLLQTAGAVVMKHSIVILDRLIKEHGLSSKKVIDMHDEAQFECLPEEADAHGQLAIQSIKEAGELLELNCPLDAEYKIGRNWAETH